MAEDKKSSGRFAEFEEYDDEPVSEKYKRPTVFGTVIRVIFYALIILVNCAVIFRVCMADDPDDVTAPVINDTLIEAYKSSDDFKIYTQTVFDMYTPDGVFYSTGMFYSPDADQVQITVRYNVRTMTEALIREELDIDDENMVTDEMRAQSKYGKITPDEVRDGEFFAFRLSDDSENLYTPTKVEKNNRFLYVYYTLTFDNIEMEADLEDVDLKAENVKVSNNSNLYINLYTLHDGIADFEKDPVGSMKIYSNERTSDEYKLSGSEKSALSK